jgi:hypothetical protein
MRTCDPPGARMDARRKVFALLETTPEGRNKWGNKLQEHAKTPIIRPPNSHPHIIQTLTQKWVAAAVELFPLHACRCEKPPHDGADLRFLPPTRRWHTGGKQTGNGGGCSRSPLATKVLEHGAQIGGRRKPALARAGEGRNPKPVTTSEKATRKNANQIS